MQTNLPSYLARHYVYFQPALSGGIHILDQGKKCNELIFLLSVNHAIKILKLRQTGLFLSSRKKTKKFTLNFRHCYENLRRIVSDLFGKAKLPTGVDPAKCEFYTENLSFR